MGKKPAARIDNEIARGAAWMLAFKMADRSIGLVSTLILARMLVPADFGVVAMSMILVAALNLLVSFGFDTQLIQNRQAGRDHFDTAWTFNVLFAAACGVVLVLLAPYAAAFYREPRLVDVIYVLALGFVIQGCANIGTVAFRREMRFDREFKFLLSKRLATLVVTIPLAFLLQNYWALVFGQLAGTVLQVVLSYVVSTYRPRFSLKARLEMFHSSKWLMINNILQFVNGRSGSFVVGRVTNAQMLGMHSIATEIATLPTTELVAPINRAAFPGYAKAADDLEQLRASFLNVIASIALIALPSGIGILMVAELLVPAALGWKWVGAIPLIQIMAVYGVIQAMQTNISYVYLALGKMRLITVIWCVQVAILLAVLIPMTWKLGVVGAAWSYLATAILMIPVNQILVARCLGLSSTRFGRQLLRPFVASLAMAAAVYAVKSQLVLRHVTLDYVLALVLCMAVGALTYVAALYLLWRLSARPAGLERYAFGRAEGVLGKVGIRINLVG